MAEEVCAAVAVGASADVLASQPDAAAPVKPVLPPAASIFSVLAPATPEGEGQCGAAASVCRARVGELLGVFPTPTFTMLTSRGMPLSLRPEVLEAQFKGRPLLYELPVGDLLVRQDVVKQGPESSQGCRGFWPHLKGHFTYCSFRNPRLNPSVHGGDSVCSVETIGGRRKVPPKDVLDLQKVMRANIVAAPGEEVPLDVTATRRLHRAVVRAAEWLKDILEAKAKEPELAFDWHVLASVQGGGDLKIRQKACAGISAMPVAGVWVGGLGYTESLASRARVLEAVTDALPPSLPRFLPLGSGEPVEVLQAVLLGIDALEVTHPTQAAAQGLALTFSWEMPAEDLSEAQVRNGEALLLALMPPSVPTADVLASEGQTPVEPAVVTSPAPPRSARQLTLRSSECREDFRPISQDSPVRQYSRAYLYHLLEVRELLGTMLLTQHNLYVYESFFEAIRDHIQRGTIRRYAAWFLRTQTCEMAAPPQEGPTPKKRRFG